MIAVACSCLAQTPGTTHVTLRQQPYSTGINDTVAQIVDALDPALLRHVSDGGLESQLIAAAEQVARLTVRGELGKVGGFRTLTTESGDTLLARWIDQNPQFKDQDVWLWDSPTATAFVFQVALAQMDPVQLSRHLEDLLIWDQLPVKLTALELYYWPQAGGEMKISGKGRHIQQEIGTFYWWMDAASKGGKGGSGLL